MSVTEDWSFESLTEENTIFNQAHLAFLEMLNDFDINTPEFIKDLFKGCVNFSKENRLTFMNVNYFSG